MEQTEQQVKLYDPLDVAEGFSLAYGQAQDLLVMIKAVKTIYESEIQYFGYITEGNRPHVHYGLRELSENRKQMQ